MQGVALNHAGSFHATPIGKGKIGLWGRHFGPETGPVAGTVPSNKCPSSIRPQMVGCIFSSAWGRGFVHGAGLEIGGPKTDMCPSLTCRRIVDRMDRAGDGDGWVSLAELRSWIAHTQQRHIRDSVSAAWDTYDTDRDGRVGWEELRNATYGHYAPGTRRDSPQHTVTLTILTLRLEDP